MPIIIRPLGTVTDISCQNPVKLSSKYISFLEFDSSGGSSIDEDRWLLKDRRQPGWDSSSCSLFLLLGEVHRRSPKGKKSPAEIKREENPEREREMTRERAGRKKEGEGKNDCRSHVTQRGIFHEMNHVTSHEIWSWAGDIHVKERSPGKGSALRNEGCGGKKDRRGKMESACRNLQSLPKRSPRWHVGVGSLLISGIPSSDGFSIFYFSFLFLTFRLSFFSIFLVIDFPPPSPPPNPALTMKERGTVTAFLWCQFSGFLLIEPDGESALL